MAEPQQPASTARPGPPWLHRAMSPLIARTLARQITRQYPELDVDARLAKLRVGLPEHGAVDAEDILVRVEKILRTHPGPGLPGDVPSAMAPTVAGSRLPSAIVLVLANLLPLFGVLLLDWSVFAVILLFWIENVIVGLLNVARMLCAVPGDAAVWAGKLFMVPFFCLHYGMFTAVHGLFVFNMFGDRSGAAARGFLPLRDIVAELGQLGLWLPAAALAGSHLFSFFWNYLWRGEHRHASIARLMQQPYRRVMVLHVVIIFGAMAVAALGSPVWALLLLVAIKLGVDLHAHLREHAKLAPAG